LLGVSFRSLFSLQPLNLSLWTWIGFAGVVGLALLEGLLWSSAWAQWWQGQEPSSTRLVRQGLWKLGRVMMSWSLRLRVLLLGLALPLLTWQGAGQSSLHALLWPLLGGWLFGLWTLWWMPALLGWRAERRLKKQARHS
jgi:Cu/Ag efflux pump CusA